MNKIDVLIKKKKKERKGLTKGVISLPGISEIVIQNVVISIMEINYKKNCHKSK